MRFDSFDSGPRKKMENISNLSLESMEHECLMSNYFVSTPNHSQLKRHDFFWFAINTMIVAPTEHVTVAMCEARLCLFLWQNQLFKWEIATIFDSTKARPLDRQTLSYWVSVVAEFYSKKLIKIHKTEIVRVYTHRWEYSTKWREKIVWKWKIYFRSVMGVFEIFQLFT